MWGAADRGFLYLKHIEFIDLSCIRRDTHVAPLGLWVKQDLRPTRVCMQFRWGIWGRHALPYTLRSSGEQGLEGSSFYRYTAPLERKTHVVSPGLWVKQDLRPTRVCMQFRWGIWGRHALPYTLRSSGGQGLEGSSFYRYTAPLERKTHVVSPGLMRKKKRSADLRSLRINCAGKMPDLRACVQVTAYGVCLLLANRRGFR